jgi:hypothetical protein
MAVRGGPPKSAVGRCDCPQIRPHSDAKERCPTSDVKATICIARRVLSTDRCQCQTAGPPGDERSCAQQTLARADGLSRSAAHPRRSRDVQDMPAGVDVQRVRRRRRRLAGRGARGILYLRGPGEFPQWCGPALSSLSIVIPRAPIPHALDPQVRCLTKALGNRMRSRVQLC